MVFKVLRKYFRLFPVILFILLLILYLYMLFLNKNNIQLDRVFLTLPISVPIIFIDKWLNLFKRFLIAAIVNELLRTILFVVNIDKCLISINVVFIITICCLLVSCFMLFLNSRSTNKL
jgi:hypothetical protein